MHLCHRNLVGTVVRSIATVDAFAGEHGRLVLTLENHGGHGAHRHSNARPLDSGRVTVSVPADASGARRPRGAAREARPGARSNASNYLPRSRSACSAPGPGCILPLSLLAWPAPRGRREPPPETAAGGNALAVHRAGDEEWAGLARIPRRRLAAPGGLGRLRARPRPAGEDLPVAGHASPRSSTSRPCRDRTSSNASSNSSAWIVAAHARGERYGLRLGEQRGGAGQRQRAPRALPQRPGAPRQR